MRESARAARAYEDYLAMGEPRSLRALASVYQAASGPPTTKLQTLMDWSRRHGWQERLAGQIAREREDAEAAVRAERARVFGEGFSLDYRRVQALQGIATKALRDLQALDFAVADGRELRGRIDGLRGCLADIAAEVGGRVKPEKLPGLDQVPAGGAYRFREVIVEMPAASGELESHATGPGETLGEPVDTGR